MSREGRAPAPGAYMKAPAILAVLSPKKSLDILHKFILRHCCMPKPIPKPSSGKWSKQAAVSSSHCSINACKSGI